MTINERMAAAGIPGRPYTIADQLDWAAAELSVGVQAEIGYTPPETLPHPPTVEVAQ